MIARLLRRLTAWLGRIRKALAAPILAVAAVVGDWIASGSLDMASLRMALAGLFLGVVTWFLPNDPEPGHEAEPLPLIQGRS